MASELEDALKSVAEASEAATDAKEETEETEAEVEAKAEAETKEVPESKEKSKGTAQDRIRGLSGKVKDLSTQLDGLTGKLTERDQEIAKLVDLLEIREKDSRLIERINELYESGPEEVKANIKNLNDVLTGVNTQIEEVKEQAKEAKDVGDKSTLKEIGRLQKELESTKSTLENQIADQGDQMLLDKSDKILERVFAELGEEYTDDDRRVLSKEVIDQINWEAIEENPDSLEQQVLEGFTKTREWYGTPRGALLKGSTNKETKPDLSVDNLLKVDWGKTKEVKGAKVAEFSDAAFTDALAEAMRQANKSPR
jgi:chromosome segregation ATPase